MKFYSEPEMEILRLTRSIVYTASEPNSEDETYGEGDFEEVGDGNDL